MLKINILISIICTIIALLDQTLLSGPYLHVKFNTHKQIGTAYPKKEISFIISMYSLYFFLPLNNGRLILIQNTFCFPLKEKHGLNKGKIR